MMTVNRTKIGYADFSGGDANFVIGCTSISAGCKNCYAWALYARWGKEDLFDKVRFYPEKLERLRRASFDPGAVPFRRGPGSRPLVFVVDMGDLFHSDVTDEQIHMAYDVMRFRADVDWLVLTKRARRLCDWTRFYLSADGWPPNVWIGVSIEDVQAASRLKYLCWTPAQGVRWISAEPMLEPLALSSAPFFWPE